MQPLVTLEWATNYFLHSRPKADEWDAADDMERQRYLGWASVLIRSAFVLSADVILDNADRIRVAVCEQALWLMRRSDEYPDVLTKGLSNASAGSLSATFSKEFVAPLICEEAKLAIGDAGYFVGSMAVVKTMPLGGVWAEPTMPKLPANVPVENCNHRPMTDNEVNELFHRRFTS